jgi:uncharacterized protein
MGFVTYVRDTLQNLVTGLGRPGIDPSKAVTYVLDLLARDVLENMYRGDWIARKIVDQPAEDMTREWRAWQANQQQIEALEEVEKAIDLQRKVKQWIIKARLYGGSALIIGVDDGNPPYEPLDLEKCKKGCLKYVVVLHRWELNAGPRIYNVMDPYYTRAAYYTVATPMFGFSGEPGTTMPVRPGQTEQVPGALAKATPSSKIIPFGRKNYPITTPTNIGLEQIHPSRVLELPGNELPDWRLAPMGGGWGDSILQTVIDTMNSFITTYQSISAMVADGKLDVVKIPDMTNNLTDTKYKGRLIERFALSAQTKSVISALLLDKEEDWDRVSTNYGGLDMILHEFLTLLSGAAGIPVSILFGQAYGRGLKGGSTGGGADDVRSYYDSCATKQKNDIAPRLGMLDQVLMRTALGKVDPNIHYEWNPLWQLSDDDKAKISLAKAQTTQIYTTIGLINQDALREGTVNQLIEDGTYPGLDDAIEEYGSEPEEPDNTGGFQPGGGGTQPGGGGGGGGGNPFSFEPGGSPDSEDLGFGGKVGDEGPGHPFRGNQYTAGQSGGGQQERISREGSPAPEEHARKTRVFLSTDMAKSAIRSAVSEVIATGEHIVKHEAEVAVTSGMLAALTALGAPAVPAAIAASVAGYAVHRIARKLGVDHGAAHRLLKAASGGLRKMAETAKHSTYSGFPQQAFGFGDADEDSVSRALRLLDDALQRHSADELMGFLQEYEKHGFHRDEAPGHPFRGNQYTTGESGGGKGEEEKGFKGGATQGPHPGHGYSKKAYVDPNGVIQTDDVRDATRALWTGRKVELHQISEVSTLLDHLGAVAARMEKAGNKAPNFDLCNVSVSNTNLFCAESHGIPRAKMPQLSSQQTADFVPYLEKQGFKIKDGQEYAANLKATQTELKGAQVAGMMKFLRTGIGKDGKKDEAGRQALEDRPLIISRDNYIMDGHHSWAARIGIDAADGKLRDDKQMNVRRVDIGIIHLLHMANKFTGKAGRKGVKDRNLLHIFDAMFDYDPNQPRAASAPGHSSGEFAAYGRSGIGGGTPWGSRESVSGGFGAGIEAISGGAYAAEEHIGQATGGRTEPPGGRKASPIVPDKLVQAIEDHVIGMAGEVGRHGAADLSEWLMRTHRKDMLAIADATRDDFVLLHKGDLKVNMPTVWLLMWNKNFATSIHDHLESEVGVTVLRGNVGNRVYESPPGYLEQAKSKEGLDARTGESTLKQNKTIQLKSPYIHQMYGTAEPGATRDVTVHAYAPPLSQMHYFKKDSKGKLHYAGDWDESRTPEDMVVREKIGDAMRFFGCPCCAPRLLTDFNPYHEPAGSPEGGRFASGQGAVGSKKNR